MKKRIIKYLIILFSHLAVLYPMWVRIGTLHWQSGFTVLPNLFPLLFPLFGLAAFSMLWLHSMSGVFEPWLRKNFDFDQFVYVTANLIFVCIIAHPLLLLIDSGFSFGIVFSHGDVDDIWFGIVAWILLMTYDIGKALKRHDFFVRNWNNILTISTLGFLVAFIHSLAIGSDLQSGPLRIIWIFYGTTGILATIYTYGIKRYLRQGIFST